MVKRTHLRRLCPALTAALAGFQLGTLARALWQKRGHRPVKAFRAGAGAVIVDDGGEVLALERKDMAGSWQLPQGGLEAGEEPLAAAIREVAEETGIASHYLEILTPEPFLLAYELPAAIRRRKPIRGQAQYWFFFRFTGPEAAITLGDGREFQDWRWMPLEKLATTVVPFRRRVYRTLAQKLPTLSPHSK